MTDTTRHATNTDLGDHGTMTEVFAHHQRRLVAMGRRMGCDPDRAHDAVQEAFITAWRFADRYDPERPVGSWLSAITRSTVIDLHRKDERAVPLAALTEASGVPDAGAERELSLGMTRSAVRRTVTALPAVEREAVTLSHFEGLTHDEIAARLGCRSAPSSLGSSAPTAASPCCSPTSTTTPRPSAGRESPRQSARVLRDAQGDA